MQKENSTIQYILMTKKIYYLNSLLIFIKLFKCNLLAFNNSQLPTFFCSFLENPHFNDVSFYIQKPYTNHNANQERSEIEKPLPVLKELHKSSHVHNLFINFPKILRKLVASLVTQE